MYLTSVTQRERLLEVATRWFADRPEPGDGRGGDEEEDEEAWYKAPDGAFFMERRSPFFHFNFFPYAFVAGLFLYMVYSIAVDYKERLRSPPTSSKLSSDLKQRFPMLVLCNYEEDLPIHPLRAIFRNTLHDIEVDVTGSFVPINCDGAPTECAVLDVEFPAFQSTENERACIDKFYLDVVADIDPAAYSRTPYRGAEAYLWKKGNRRKVEENLCSDALYYSRCSTLATVYDGCSEELGELAYDEFPVPAGSATLVSLSTSVTQFAPECDVMFTSWNPKVTSMPYAESVVNSWFPSNYSFDIDGIILMTMAFTTPRVTVTTYNYVSASAFFGSLAGWFGVCTDGWGIISALYMIERLILYLKDRRGG